MKVVDRVIFCLNNNGTYIDFWNFVSKLYKIKFNVTPTLVFVGSYEEYNTLSNEGRLSTEYGEVIHLSRVEDIPYNSGDGEGKDWTPTWGLFYGAALFPDDICMLSGIDQIPLGSIFFDIVKNIDINKKYLIGFADAYTVLHNIKTASLSNEEEFFVYPSSHHVGFGKMFKDIYEIEDSWEDEIKKVNSYIGKFIINQTVEAYHFSAGWGIDEVYSSYKIHQKMKEDKDRFFLVNDWYENWLNKRIDRSTHGALNLDNEIENKIINNEIPEYSALRPYYQNNINSFDRILEIMPEYKNLRNI